MYMKKIGPFLHLNIAHLTFICGDSVDILWARVLWKRLADGLLSKKNVDGEKKILNEMQELNPDWNFFGDQEMFVHVQHWSI